MANDIMHAGRWQLQELSMQDLAAWVNPLCAMVTRLYDCLERRPPCEALERSAGCVSVTWRGQSSKSHLAQAYDTHNTGLHV